MKTILLLTVLFFGSMSFAGEPYLDSTSILDCAIKDNSVRFKLTTRRYFQDSSSGNSSNVVRVEEELNLTQFAWGDKDLSGTVVFQHATFEGLAEGLTNPDGSFLKIDYFPKDSRGLLPPGKLVDAQVKVSDPVITHILIKGILPDFIDPRDPLTFNVHLYAIHKSEPNDPMVRGVTTMFCKEKETGK